MGYPLKPLIDLSDPAVMRERAMARNVAAAGYFFWRPCPLCGLEFGGQEWVRGSEDKPASIHMPGDSPQIGTGICPFCTMAGRGADPRWNAHDALRKHLEETGVL